MDKSKDQKSKNKNTFIILEGGGGKNFFLNGFPIQRHIKSGHYKSFSDKWVTRRKILTGAKSQMLLKKSHNLIVT